MKKQWLRLVSMLLCALLMTTCAQAELLYEQSSGLFSVMYTAKAGDSVYFLTRTDRTVQLRRWQGTGDVEILADDLPCLPYSAGDDEVMTSCSVLFSDGEDLYALDHYSGNVLSIAVDDAGKASFSVLATLKDMDPLYAVPGDSSTFMQPEKILKVGGCLVIQSRMTMSSTDGVLVYNLKSGYAKRAALLGIRGMCAYRDGKVLLRTEKDVYSYDPLTDETVRLCDAPFKQWKEMIWHEGWQMLIWQDGTALMAAELGGEAQMVGYTAYGSSGKIELLGDTLIVSGTYAIYAEPIAQDYRAEHSVIVSAATTADVIERFMREHPEVYVKDGVKTANNLEALAADEVDVVRLALESRNFSQAVENGWLLDMSGYPDVMERIEQLYPAFREAATVDGAVYGIPMAVSGHSGWRINREVMEGMGLTEADIPTNLIDLCAFATRWNNEWVAQYPQYTLINDTEEYRSRIFTEVLQLWSDYCAYTDQPLHYDDPIFTQLLAAFDEMQVEALNENQHAANPEESEYKQSLLWTGCKALNVWEMPDGNAKQTAIEMKITADAPAVTAATHLAFACVSANAQSPEYAVEMAIALADAAETAQAYTLYSTRTEPVENESYEHEIAQLKEDIAWLEASKAESVNPDAVQHQIDELNARAAEQEAMHRYIISPKAIERYANQIAPGVIVRVQDGVTGWKQETAFADLISQYLAGGMDAEDFITEMDRALQ